MVFREAFKFATAPIVLGMGAWWLGWTWIAVLLLVLAAFVLYFFRDPERTLPASLSAVVSPADGRVLEVVADEVDGRPGRRISIFLSVFNVHVNRAPVAGKIDKVEYRPGKFHAAMRPRASSENEQNVIGMVTGQGPVEMKQIAGLVARRVMLWRSAGEQVERGERIGMIRFGSRVELWLPEDAEVLVKAGDHVKGGASAIAEWR